MDDYVLRMETAPVTVYVSNTYISTVNSWTGTTNFSWNYQRPLYFNDPKTESEIRSSDIEYILKRHGRTLSPAEKSFIRKFNARPTTRGIRTCEKRHGRALKFAAMAPELQARFDRRIPCWRAGRWKSLT